MNYRELKAALNRLSEEQLDQDVTLYSIDNDEVLSLSDDAAALQIVGQEDGHPYIVF